MKSMISLSLLLSFAPALALANNPSPEDLLKESDRARGTIETGVVWESVVKTHDKEGTNEVRYLIKAKGVDALAEAIAPARNKGETMLFNDRNLWFFKPGLKKPIAISPRQKLMGEAANGDIASTNYYRDYQGTVTGEETVDGVPCWKMQLKAKAKNVTYDGIRYWISKKDRYGVKAEFLSLNGEAFKSAQFEYKNSIKDGKGGQQVFVSKMTIVDAINKNNYTVIAYETVNMQDIADSVFNINNLSR